MAGVLVDMKQKRALLGGKFYPGDKVIVGDGSGPEMLHVQDDGVTVYPNPADVGSDGLPQIPALAPVTDENGNSLPVSNDQLPQITPEPQATAANTLPAIAPPPTAPANSALPTIGPDANLAMAGQNAPDVGRYLQDQQLQVPTIQATTPADGGDETPAAIAQNPLDAQIASLRQEYSKNFRNQDPNHKHSIWSRIAAATLGWTKGGLIGGIQAARNPHYFEDQKTAENQARVAPQLASLETERKNEDAHIKVGADITGDIADRKQKDAEDAAKEGAATAKIAADKEYKTNLINLGREKADNIKSYRDAIVDLRKQGVQQGDDRITALNKRIDEEARHNKATEGLSGQRIQTTQQQGDLNRQLKLQIHSDVQKNGVTAVRTRMQSAFVSEFQRANHGKMPTQQQIDDHMKTNVEPLLADQ